MVDGWVGLWVSRKFINIFCCKWNFLVFFTVSCSVLSDWTRCSQTSPRDQSGVLGCFIPDRWVFGQGTSFTFIVSSPPFADLCLLCAAGENVREFFFRVASLAFETNVLAELEKSGSKQIGDVVREYPDALCVIWKPCLSSNFSIPVLQELTARQTTCMLHRRRNSPVAVSKDGGSSSESRYRLEIRIFFPQWEKTGSALRDFCGRSRRRDAGVSLPVFHFILPL